MELKLYVECVTFVLCSLTLVECWYVSHDVERGSVKTISQIMVNKIDRPNTTPTVHAICKFAVYSSVFRPFSRFSLVCEGHRRYCIIRRKLEPWDCAMADLKRSKLCVISAVIFS